MTKIPLLDRQKERDQLLTAVRRGTVEFLFSAQGYHVSGDADVGKTWLVNCIDREAADIERAIRIHGDLSAKWSTLDPLERMVGVRNVLHRSSKAFDPEAFDIALTVFLAKFRPGYGLEVATSEAGRPQIIEESLRDTAKKFLEGAAGDLSTASLSGAVTVAGVKAASAGGVIASAGAIAIPAVTVGAITLATATGAVACKRLIRLMRERAHRRDLLARYERLAHFLSSDHADDDDFFDFLTMLLGDAISRMRDGKSGYLPVLFLDPADDLSEHPEGPTAQVGRMLTKVFSHVGRQLVIASSRKPLAEWEVATRSAATAPPLVYHEIRLNYIGLDEAGKLVRREGYDGDWPVHGMPIVQDSYVRPKVLADWWRRFKEPPVAESETV